MTLVGPNYYPSAVIGTKASADPSFDIVFLATGTGPFSDGDSPSRWGDYFGIALDPDGRRFWAEGTYSTAGWWATKIGSFSTTTVVATPTPAPTQPPTPAPTQPPTSGAPVPATGALSLLLTTNDVGGVYVQTRQKQDTIDEQAAGVTNPAPYANGVDLLRAWGFVDSWLRDFANSSGSGIYALTSQATLYSTSQGASSDYGLNLDQVARSNLGFRTIGTGTTIGTQSSAFQRDYTTTTTTGAPVAVTEVYIVFWSGTASDTLDVFSYQGQMDFAFAIRLARLQAARSQTAPLPGSPTAVPATPTPPPTPIPSASPPPVSACTSTTGPGIPPPSGMATGISGYHAAWYGQSGYPTLCQGQRSTATVAFLNTGSFGWVLAAPGQTAFLGTWDPEPGQDQPSPLGGDGTHGSPNTGWPAYNRVAIQPSGYVGPGQVAWFQFSIQAPQTPGTYRLALRAVIEGSQWMEDYGVFWYVTVKAQTAAPAPTPSPTPIGTLTIGPLTATLAVGGSQQFVVTAIPPGSIVAWSVAGGCGTITSGGLFVATAPTLPTQPCFVIATASGLVATAQLAIVPSPTPVPLPTPAPTPVLRTIFGPGRYIVGVDIAAGTYRLRATVSHCYWERLSGFGGTFSEILGNNNVFNSTEIVTISSTDRGFYSSSDCGTWTNDLSPITSNPTAPFANGTYIVGTDIAPGTWRGSLTSSSCYWERLNGFGGLLFNIIANELTVSSTVVTISASDRGFRTNGCQWTKVG
jgi:hypothetical protein